MPAFFINPINEEHIDLLKSLDKQNQDLRVFVSDKNSQNFIDRLPGKKAIGDITDDSHTVSYTHLTLPTKRIV